MPQLIETTDTPAVSAAGRHRRVKIGIELVACLEQNDVRVGGDQCAHSTSRDSSTSQLRGRIRWPARSPRFGSAPLASVHPRTLKMLQAELGTERRGVSDDIRIVVSIDDGDRWPAPVPATPFKLIEFIP